MGLIFSKTSIQREDAQIAAAQAAVAEGRPLDGEGAGEFEQKNPNMKFGVGMRKSAEKKAKEEAKKAEKEEKKKERKITKVKNIRHGRTDLLDGEE